MADLDDVVAALLVIEDACAKKNGYSPDHKGYEDALKWWLGSVEAMETEPYWKDGGHMGDCTKQPNTCMRCFVETSRRTAELLMHEVWDGDLEALLRASGETEGQ